MPAATDDARQWLTERWLARWPTLPQVGADLVERYADPARVYHGFGHLVDVLRHLDELGGSGPDADDVQLAAWFHDAVYDVRRRDNEAASAALAHELLGPSTASATVAEVARLVLVTADHAVEPGDRGGALLCDADLAILAAPGTHYDDYVARVRQEYAAVPDAAFRSGRADVLRRLLALPTLFHTAYGLVHWESPARANLTRELTDHPSR